MRRSPPGCLCGIEREDLAGLAPMIKAVAGWLVGSGVLLAPTGLQATSLHPCGSIRIANTTFCFLDANGDGRYQEGDEEFCLDGWLTRGGLRCRGQGVIAKPAAESGVLKIRVLTSWDEACPGSKSVDSINQHLRDGYRIVGTKTHTEMQVKADGSSACTYTTYSLKQR